MVSGEPAVTQSAHCMRRDAAGKQMNGNRALKQSQLSMTYTTKDSFKIAEIQNLPSPWSSCWCQSELGALVTWNPTPCHLHYMNIHLQKQKTYWKIRVMYYKLQRNAHTSYIITKQRSTTVHISGPWFEAILRLVFLFNVKIVSLTITSEERREDMGSCL